MSGEPVSGEPVSGEPVSGPGPAGQALDRSPDGRLAWTGTLLGAIGLFFLNLVFGPIAIALGTTALRRGAPRAAALAAVALGTADLAVLAALVLHSATHGGVVWRFGS